jgi:hypothetical protein
MVIVPCANRYAHHRERAQAAELLVTLKLDYTALKDIIADMAQQLQKFDSSYGAIINDHEPYGIRNIAPSQLQ